MKKQRIKELNQIASFTLVYWSKYKDLKTDHDNIHKESTKARWDFLIHVILFNFIMKRKVFSKSNLWVHKSL